MTTPEPTLRDVVAILGNINTRFDTIDKRLNTIDTRLDRIESDVSSLKTDVSSLKTDVSSLKKDNIHLQVKIGELNVNMQQNFDNVYLYMGEAFGKISGLQMQSQADGWRQSMRATFSK